MIQRVSRYFRNLVKFVRYGGIVNLNVVNVQYDQLLKKKNANGEYNLIETDF
jgi:hypothetical protein